MTESLDLHGSTTSPSGTLQKASLTPRAVAILNSFSEAGLRHTSPWSFQM